MIISFEGIDGCGKSTQENLLATYLKAAGYVTRRVREPGGTVISEQIRDILLDRKSDIDPFSEMLLFSAARAQLCRTVLKSWNAAGDIILCDRFFDSTVAYQGGGRGVADPIWLNKFQRQVTGGLVPDRTYYFQIDVETADARRAARVDQGAGRLKADRMEADRMEADRMESAGPAFFKKVGDVYDALARQEPDRILVIDASRDIESVFKIIQTDVDQLLNDLHNPESSELPRSNAGKHID